MNIHIYRQFVKLLILSLSLFGGPVAKASDYGYYDLKKLILVSETTNGKRYEIDATYLDRVLNDLLSHAANYPPKFDSMEDGQRAKENLVTLSGMFDAMGETSNIEMLRRIGLINAMAHSLDIPGTVERAKKSYLKLLDMAQNDPQANYMFGIFLGGIGASKEALPYLEKALSLGIKDASYPIGMTYLSLGDKDRALENLELFKRQHPGDVNLDRMLSAIRSGNIEIKKN